MIYTGKALDEKIEYIEKLNDIIGNPDPPPYNFYTSLPEGQMYSYIYVIQSHIGGPIKVGKSNDPYTRLKQLQTSYPYKLIIVHMFRVPIRYVYPETVEKVLHQMLAEYALMGEWMSEEALYKLRDIVKESKLNEYEVKKGEMY